MNQTNESSRAIDAPLVARRDAEQLDESDPLGHLRDRFHLPPRMMYLCGNSLGPMPGNVARRMREVIEREWAEDLIVSWNVHDWFGLPERVGARISRLIGARPHEVIVADSTSVNLHKVVTAALRMQRGRRVIVSETGNFPTDAYVLQGIARGAGSAADGRAVARSEVLGAIDEDTAVVVLTHVHYRDCATFDMQTVTRRAHEAGALIVWDLSHSVGAMPVDLEAAGADFAVGCTYKYVNGGPGAPAFIFAAERHHDRLDPDLLGWWGHESPFDLREDYRPAKGMRRLLTGTASIPALAALDAALDVFDGVELSELRRKSVGLTSAFMGLVRERCAGFGIEIATTDDPRQRGSHVALRHPQSYAIMRALIARNVIGDFRAPDVMRFGFAPLYVRYCDVWDTVEILADVLRREEWRKPEFAQRSRVT